MSEPQKVKVIKANYILQAKVGMGPLDTARVEACQRVIDENTVDFAPMAKIYLDQLGATIEKIKQNQIELNKAIAEMTQPVMELKANASLFKYDLIGNLANIMLSFLEAVKSIDKTVIEIVEAHHKTLTAITIKKMKGDGGPAGKRLEQELKDACKRYFNSKKSS